jgi:hypothetical protein
MACLLSVAAWLPACSDDPKTEKRANNMDAGTDAGRTQDPDAATALEPLVLNTGDACETESDCEGPSPVCMTMLELPAGGPPGGAPMASREINFPGGYCTANCTASAQCGGTAECGVTELLNDLEPILAQMGAPDIDPSQFPSQCLRLCASNGTCRDGYRCQTIIDAAGLGAQFPIPAGFLARYCLPRQGLTPGDAGMDAGGMGDAGMGDAGMGDAGADDAGG